MKYGISDDSVRFLAETSFETVHVYAAARACRVPYEDNTAIFPSDDLVTLRKGCLILWDKQPATGEQHFREICKDLRRRKKRIGFSGLN